MPRKKVAPSKKVSAAKVVADIKTDIESTTSSLDKFSKINNALYGLYGPPGLNNLNGLGPYGLETLQNGPTISDINTIFGNLRWYLISNLRQVLSQIYVEFGIVKTIIDVPVDDAFRGGVQIITDQLDTEQIKDLETALDQDADIGVYALAQKWNRLFGGAGVITLTGKDWEEPLKISDISAGDIIGFRAVDMWELYGDRQNLENGEGNLEDIHSEYYSYYGKKIHRSRIHMMKGLEAPSFVRPRLRGWGFSLVETVIRSINQYLKTSDLIFELLDEFKVDYYKFKGLANLLAVPQGMQGVHARVSSMNQMKNYNSAVVMDSEDDFTQRQLQFTGVADIMKEIRMQVACDLRMPQSKIFGISSVGFSSGEDDIENYNAMVEGEVRAKSKRGLINMIKIRCQQLFGFVPEDLNIEFMPLRMLSAEQEENVKSQKFARLIQAVSSGHMDEKSFKQACNKDNLLGIQLDVDQEKLEPEPEMEGDGTGTGEDLKDNISQEKIKLAEHPKPSKVNKQPEAKT